MNASVLVLHATALQLNQPIRFEMLQAALSYCPLTRMFAASCLNS